MDPFAVKEAESPGMDRAEAARMAKECIISLFDDEDIRDIGFEELKFDSVRECGQSPSDSPTNGNMAAVRNTPSTMPATFRAPIKPYTSMTKRGRIKEIKDRFMVDSFLVNRQ